MDWFLYDNGLRHKRVKKLFDSRSAISHIVKEETREILHNQIIVNHGCNERFRFYNRKYI